MTYIFEIIYSPIVHNLLIHHGAVCVAHRTPPVFPWHLNVYWACRIPLRVK